VSSVSTARHKDERKVRVDVAALERRSAALTSRPVTSGPPHTTSDVFYFLRWLKPHLFMEAEELTVAYPTVQHAIDVDVVGLWEGEGTH